MTDQQLVKREDTGMERVKGYLMSPEVKGRFEEMMGRSGIYYLNQVMILVANSDALQKCSPKSILIAAMRAASLRLSVDPGQGQAWIIPYGGVATFQLGYKGVYELAQRTNLYRHINYDIEVFEGETVIQNRMTGIHTITGQRTGNRIIGRMLYFELVNGFHKTFYMTIEEIYAHAKHYSKAFNSSSSKWNDPHEQPKMEKKTVMINGLRRYGRFNQADIEIINQIEEEQGFVDGMPDEDSVTRIEPQKHTEAENMRALGFDVGPEPTQTAAPQTAPAAPTIDWTSTKVSLATATTEGSKSDGLYWTMDTPALVIRYNSIIGAMDGKTAEVRESAQRKADIIQAIIDYRNTNGQ